MQEVKKLTAQDGSCIQILSSGNIDITAILASNRNIAHDTLPLFLNPSIDDLHDPFLMPDMHAAVSRIMRAKERNERVVIFGDYDADGVSSTALLVRFLTEHLGMTVSYRLPHRVHDGYGLKSYFFDDLSEKNVTLVITVDCGTRDIEPIKHAKSLGIDVIVTDHHAVPQTIPTEVIGILNPKRHDSLYPFSGLAGAGVAFKLVHALILHTYPDASQKDIRDALLTQYIDIATLGTIADCMPLVGENRIIAKLGLAQMNTSTTHALRQYLQATEQDATDNADIVGFQIGPRINAAGRMDTPLIALRWLLASEHRTEEFFEQIESLNAERKGVVTDWTEKAMQSVDTNNPVLIYTSPELEHGIIGLIAGKLTEAYHRPSIVLCPGSPITNEDGSTEETLVASCRSPEWCDLIPLLDDNKAFFVRYGGHRQAAGFTIKTAQLSDFSVAINNSLRAEYPEGNFPRAAIQVEAPLTPDQLSFETLHAIQAFRPFGIGNPRPLWLLENVTISECRSIGKTGEHLKMRLHEHPITLIYWNGKKQESHLSVGNTISCVIMLESREWNKEEILQGIIQCLVQTE